VNLRGEASLTAGISRKHLLISLGSGIDIPVEACVEITHLIGPAAWL
jgi:hypothetical protein